MSYAAKTFGYSFGAIYVLLSLVGFGITGFSEWLETDVDYHLVIFRMNAAQNALHMLLGIALMAGAADTEAFARRVALVAGLVFGGIGIWGFYAYESEWNVIATNEATSLLHLATAAVALVAAVASQPADSSAEADAPAEEAG
ncbi:MAG: DUF4383 domain-containing protein [Actinomycetota bacterium]|nr:DUF4383 domain-containing protein [Actinomycetota bacterium]